MSLLLTTIPVNTSCLPAQLHLLHQVLTAPFQLHQSFQLCIPPRQTSDVHLILSLPENLEELLASLSSCLFGDLHDRKTCFFRHIQLFFQFTEALRCPPDMHFPRRIFISGTPLPLQFLDFPSKLSPAMQNPPFLENSAGFLPPLSTKNSAAAAAHSSFLRGTEESLPSFLRSSRLANRLATFLAARPSFLGSPTNGFCLPLRGQFYLL